jgi:hypothetical protein
MSVRKPKITKWVLSPRKSGEKFMARHHRHDKVSKKIKAKFPQIYIDKDADFASIKIAPGNEASSYVRDGFVFL